MQGSVPIEVTPDGGATLLSSRFGEYFHNRKGALTQARRVFLEGTETHRASHPRVLEIGFGLGLNFLSTLEDAAQRGVALDYRAIEIDPQPPAWLRAIGASHRAGSEPLWQHLLNAWPALYTGASGLARVGADGADGADGLKGPVRRLEVAVADASRSALPDRWADAIYLDGFSPKVNAELWTEAFLARLGNALAPGGWIATYSAAGSVRRGLEAAGLRVERRGDLLGKREWLRAQRVEHGRADPVVRLPA